MMELETATLVKVTELENAIQIAETPQEANDIRRKVAAVQELIKNRRLTFKVAWEGGKAYCEASAKAGEEWDKIPNKREVGRPNNSKNFSNLSVTDAGFTNSIDATVCKRVGAELHPEDRRTYYDICLQENKIPTLGGIYAVWKELYLPGVAKTVDEYYQETPLLMDGVKPGEWWQLGNHRLYCGDTSSPEFIKSLSKAAFAFADPPYGAEVAEWDKEFVWRHDYLIDKAEVVAVTPGIISIFDFARITSMPYKWSVACWIDNGMTRGELGFGNWIYTALFSNGDLYRNAQDFIRVSISNKETGETSHKGRKPAGLVAYLTQLFTDKSEVIVDPFLGSGTTLFVAETMGRCCIGGEISPEYCADIISRWEARTNKKASRL